MGTLLTGMQPALITETGTLLGRTSIGPGGPEAIAIGTGLALTSAGLTATGADHAEFPVQSALQPTDEAIVNSAGAPRRIPLVALRALFSAGPNVSIDANGAISAIGGGIGPQGPAGPIGSRGASILSGTGAPSAVLGSDGDGYVDAASGDVYSRIWRALGQDRSNCRSAGTARSAGFAWPRWHSRPSWPLRSGGTARTCWRDWSRRSSRSGRTTGSLGSCRPRWTNWPVGSRRTTGFRWSVRSCRAAGPRRLTRPHWATRPLRLLYEHNDRTFGGQCGGQ